MEQEFSVTHDEKELIIECLESDIEAKSPKDEDDHMYKTWAKHRAEHLHAIIRRIR